MTGKLEDARLRVIVAFAYWLWCQRRLKDSVNSFHSFDSRSAWLASFSHLRRAARNAEVRWVAAIYGFKRLIEEAGENSAKWEKRGCSESSATETSKSHLVRGRASRRPIALGLSERFRPTA
jgi:hypothetical protein